MSRHLIAEQALTLEAAMTGIQRWFADFETSLETSAHRFDFCLDDPRLKRDVSDEVWYQCRILRDMAKSGAMSAFQKIGTERAPLREALWGIPLDGATGGHLRDYVDGEPALLAHQSWVPTELTVPEPSAIDLGIAAQNADLGNCFFVGAIRDLGAVDPERLASMVSPDPVDPDYVIVKVAAGEYRLRATLAMDDDTERAAGLTSPDGTTLVPYIEKAAAAHFGALSDLESGLAKDALAWLVGKDAVENVDNAADLSDAELTAALSRRGCIVSINSAVHPTQRPDVDALAQSGLAEAHIYNSAGVDSATGTVVLSNTWGTLDSHPGPLDFETFRQLNATLAWIKNPPSAVENG